MFGEIFYFGLLRKYVASFGTLFNDISIERTDANNNVTEIIKVPIMYGPKDKMLARVQQDPNIARQSATVTLPAISFEITSYKYDADRKLNKVGRVSRQSANTSTSLLKQYNPVPWNLGFRLSILAKNLEDANKIVEQIIPYFVPDYTLTLNIIPEMSIALDVPITLLNIEQKDEYEGNYVNRTYVTWYLDFEMKVQFYGPIKTNSIILFTNTHFYTPTQDNISDAIANSGVVSYITVKPGLTANGQPTSNNSLSVNTYLITANSDYGYIVDLEDTALGDIRKELIDDYRK
jgi:T4-like virus Myoviridae tail sheath stabiliser